MKQPSDKSTLDVLRKPDGGRSRLPTEKDTAQRVREYRQRKKFNFLNTATRDPK